MKTKLYLTLLVLLSSVGLMAQEPLVSDDLKPGRKVTEAEKDYAKNLDVNISAQVFANSGSKMFRGVGFTQSVDLDYHMDISSKARLTVGGNLSNTTFRGNNYFYGNVRALLEYHPNEHWDAWFYGQKSFQNKQMPFWMRNYEDNVDRIGGGARYTFKPGSYIEVNLEASRYNGPSYWGYGPWGYGYGPRMWGYRPAYGGYYPGYWY